MALVKCEGNPPVEQAGWKNGPLPPNTWNWGGVVTKEIGDNSGFLFADFRGDHVLLYPDNKRVEPSEIKYYNNSIGYPFKPQGS